MSRPVQRAAVALALMLFGVALSQGLTPRNRLADLPENRAKLEQIVPSAFGDWRDDESAQRGVVNPQATEVLNRIYSQIVTRAYVNSRGERVMLSISYGEDQRDALQLHYPEICYPAQGFQLNGIENGSVPFNGTLLPVRRLETHYGAARYEPVTYWIMIGHTHSLGGFDKKIEEMRYGLRGDVPDGLLFRVSSIGSDTQDQFALQGRFIADLLNAVGPEARYRLAGIR